MGIDLVFIFGILDSPKEKLAILFAEVVEAGDPITELVDDVDGGGEERVELGDAGSLPGNHPRLAVQLLLGQVRVLQQHDFNLLPKKNKNSRQILGQVSEPPIGLCSYSWPEAKEKCGTIRYTAMIGCDSSRVGERWCIVHLKGDARANTSPPESIPASSRDSPAWVSTPRAP